jgi:peroxiredoxin Q/BCP
MSHHRARRFVQLAALSLLSALVAGTGAGAQQAAPGTAATAPEVGQMAPDFTLPGATRYGLLKDPVHLSDLRGQTVVVAFFPKARTRG